MNADPTRRLFRKLLSAGVALALLVAALRPNLVHGGGAFSSDPGAAKADAASANWVP